MKFRTATAVVALATLAAGCDDKQNPTVVRTNTTNVRFVNAMQGSNTLLLTANGTAVGTPLDFANSATICTQIPAGSTNLVFGPANSGGTGLTSPLGTVSTNLVQGGSYTVVATGSGTVPALFVLNNTPISTATSGNANIRFVNATSTPVDFFLTPTATLSVPTFANVAVNSVAAVSSNNGFTVVPVANGTLTFRTAGTTNTLFTTSTTFQSGQNYTILLLPNTSGTAFQTLTLQGC